MTSNPRCAVCALAIIEASGIDTKYRCRIYTNKNGEPKRVKANGLCSEYRHR